MISEAYAALVQENEALQQQLQKLQREYNELVLDYDQKRRWAKRLETTITAERQELAELRQEKELLEEAVVRLRLDRDNLRRFIGAE